VGRKSHPLLAISLTRICPLGKLAESGKTREERVLLYVVSQVGCREHGAFPQLSELLPVRGFSRVSAFF